MRPTATQTSAAGLFYAVTLCATWVALLGWPGLLPSLMCLLVWGQVFSNYKRELGLFRLDHSDQTVPSQHPQLTSTSCPNICPTAQGPNNSTKTFSLWKAFLGTVCIIGLAIASFLYLPPKSDSDPMRHAEISMRVIARAIQTYHRDNGSLPPIVTYDAFGKPMHSWRALILEQLGETSLGSAYRLDEPWNSPHNSALAKYRPWHFQIFDKESADAADSQTSQSTTVQGFIESDGTFVVAEHENWNCNWLEPREVSRQDAVLELLATPQLKQGFWFEGFLVSTFRGRIAVRDQMPICVQPNCARKSRQDQWDAIEPKHQLLHRVVHSHHITQLLVLLTAVLLPLYHLRRIPVFE
ncbi:MAG: DUF1559 domain-containing protein [Planctomycetales bacterium]|nr:DUF1559 domain-containing protein [Planctomycetales bacterium]